MKKIQFNPISGLISLIVGWFLVSFLQTLVIALFNGDFRRITEKFWDTASFKDDKAALINILIIIVFGVIGTLLWFHSKKSQRKKH